MHWNFSVDEVPFTYSVSNSSTLQLGTLLAHIDGVWYVHRQWQHFAAAKAFWGVPLADIQAPPMARYCPQSSFRFQFQVRFPWEKNNIPDRTQKHRKSTKEPQTLILVFHGRFDYLRKPRHIRWVTSQTKKGKQQHLCPWDLTTVHSSPRDIRIIILDSWKPFHICSHLTTI